MNIKAVLFDLDNTLIDFMKMKRAGCRAAASAMVEAGLSADEKALGEELFDFYLKNGIESDDAFANFLLKKYGKAEPRILAAGLNAYLKEKYLHMKPYPGVAETLKELRDMGIRLAIVSDGVRLKAWMRLNEAGLDKYFDVVVTFDDTGKKKPLSEPFRKAAEELGISPDECLFVGDSPDRDIAGAKAVGMKTALARYGCIKDRGGCEADYVIDSFHDLLKILKRGSDG